LKWIQPESLGSAQVLVDEKTFLGGHRDIRTFASIGKIAIQREIVHGRSLGWALLPPKGNANVMPNKTIENQGFSRSKPTKTS
jgi:hypothetical protein